MGIVACALCGRMQIDPGLECDNCQKMGCRVCVKPFATIVGAPPDPNGFKYCDACALSIRGGQQHKPKAADVDDDDDFLELPTDEEGPDEPEFMDDR